MDLEFKNLKDCQNNFQSEWIVSGIKSEQALAYLDAFGLFLCDKTRADVKEDKEKNTSKRPGRNAVTTSQIRNIFTEVKRIEAKIENLQNDAQDSWVEDFLLLKPKIAYNTARTLQRTSNSRMKEFREVLEIAHGLVKQDKKRFRNFSKFFEAIIAFHKVYGGLEGN